MLSLVSASITRLVHMPAEVEIHNDSKVMSWIWIYSEDVFDDFAIPAKFCGTPSAPSFPRSQLGEQDNLADGCLVSQDHHQPIDTNTEATRWRHPVH
jgi:hypothetical protein